MLAALYKDIGAVYSLFCYFVVQDGYQMEKFYKTFINDETN